VHRGSTSQDILDTALMLVAVRALDLITADLDSTAESLGHLAALHRDTPMPGRTLTQHAVPTTFGLKVVGWRSLVLDAGDRLRQVRRSLPAQLGGAAGTLAAFHTHHAGSGTADDTGQALTEAFAAELGLAVPPLPWHVLRTPVADLAGALAFCAGALGKMAADVLVLSRTEIAEVAEGTGGGSSAMPHKSNPVRATLIAAVARQVPALASVLYGALVAEDERPSGAWHAEWQPFRQALRLTGAAAGAARELASGLRVFPDRMVGHLDLTGGRLLAERLDAHLGPLLGREMARRLLTEASRRSAKQHRDLADVLGDIPEIAAVVSARRLRELTDATGYLGSAAALTDRALRRGAQNHREPS
jgi:3-carboxy-cis,cis-muconate cycloisomerase